MSCSNLFPSITYYNSDHHSFPTCHCHEVLSHPNSLLPYSDTLSGIECTSHIQHKHILLHLSSPYLRFSITLHLLRLERRCYLFWNNKHEAPRLVLIRAETVCISVGFERFLNTLESRDSNRVNGIDRGLNERENFSRDVDDRVGCRIVGSYRYQMAPRLLPNRVADFIDELFKVDTRNRSRIGPRYFVGAGQRTY
jgi:hypothetical protein